MNMPLRLGISQCLIGEPVRFDGECVSRRCARTACGMVCPEVEIGLGYRASPASRKRPTVSSSDRRQYRDTNASAV
jgi:uncharacterized protein YbbK (DUF523 family)